jgi:uncharacterized membrane protein YfcA
LSIIACYECCAEWAGTKPAPTNYLRILLSYFFYQYKKEKSMEVVYLLLIGLAAGILSGLLGIGGGIIIIPALVALLGFSQKHAQGTSLAMLLPPIGILAVLNYYKAGYINLKAAGLMIITFLIGSYFASKYAVSFPEATLKKLFGAFLLIYSVKLLIGK